MPTKRSNERTKVPQEVWVLLDAPAGAKDQDLMSYGGPQRIDVAKLGEHLQSFTSAMTEVLKKVKTLAGDFELSEVSLQAKLTAEVGFVLITKAGMEGAIDLKFAKRGSGG